MITDAHRVLIHNIPIEPRDRDQWVLWRFVAAPGQQKPRKLPISPHTGYPARTHNTPGKCYRDTPHDTWADFPTALRMFQRGMWAGIGYIFTESDPFTGIDLDGCRDPSTGQIAEWARLIIDSMSTYTEVSPSGTGVKLICKAEKPAGRCRTGQFECYDRERGFVLTGWHLPGTPFTCEPRQTEFESVYRSIFPAEKPHGDSLPVPLPAIHSGTLSDDDVLSRAIQSKNGAKVAALYRGDLSEFSGDESAADASLCWRLAFWTQSEWGGGFAQLLSLMENSDLRRAKWYDRRGSGTWIEREVQQAVDGVTAVYRPGHAHDIDRKAALQKRAIILAAKEEELRCKQ